MSHVLIVGGSEPVSVPHCASASSRRGPRSRSCFANSYPNFSICGLPFYLSGEVQDWRNLAHRSAAEIEAHGIRLTMNTEATAVDPSARSVTARGADGV